MTKSLYSLMLTDEIVREVDRLCLMKGTNRSNLINQILAEYVSYTTPEMRIKSIFDIMTSLIDERNGQIALYNAPRQSTISLKSSIDYRYRPTVKYDVELFKGNEGRSIGRLSVTFRTQSGELLDRIAEFFTLWCYLEEMCFGKRKYSTGGGRLMRDIELTSSGSYSLDDIARAINAYINLLDHCMKGYLSGRLREQDVLELLQAHKAKEMLI